MWSIKSVVLLCALFIGLSGAHAQQSSGSENLLTVGVVGPDAASLTVNTGYPANHVFKEGERVKFSVTSDRDGYLIVANLAADGKVAILYPNSDNPAGFVKAGTAEELFGETSKFRVVMGKGASSKILFAFSSEKWPVQVKSASDEIVKFSAADPGWKAFVQGFTATASKKGFNRVVCVLNSQDGPGTLKLMGTKALPSKTSSEEPDQITGIQGIKGSGVK